MITSENNSEVLQNDASDKSDDYIFRERNQIRNV